MIKITGYKEPGLHLRASSDWVTNGHYMIRKDRLDPIKNAELLALAGQLELKDESAEKVIPKDADKEYKVTGEIRNADPCQDPKADIVLFANGDKDKPAGFDRKYIRMFGLADTILFGKDENCCFAARQEQPDGTMETWLVLMPKRLT